jgi:hypothetical protein
MNTVTRESKMDAEDVTNNSETGGCLLAQEVKGDIRCVEQIWLVKNSGAQEKGQKQVMRAYYVCQTGVVKLQHNFSDHLEQCEH